MSDQPDSLMERPRPLVGQPPPQLANGFQTLAAQLDALLEANQVVDRHIQQLRDRLHAKGDMESLDCGGVQPADVPSTQMEKAAFMSVQPDSLTERPQTPVGPPPPLVADGFQTVATKLDALMEDPCTQRIRDRLVSLDCGGVQLADVPSTRMEKVFDKCMDSSIAAGYSDDLGPHIQTTALASLPREAPPRDADRGIRRALSLFPRPPPTTGISIQLRTPREDLWGVPGTSKLWHKAVLPYSGRHEGCNCAGEMLVRHLDKELKAWQLGNRPTLNGKDKMTIRWIYYSRIRADTQKEKEFHVLDVTVSGTEAKLEAIEVNLGGDETEGCTKTMKLGPNEAGAIVTGCKSDDVEDRWALVEALVQVVVKTVDELPTPEKVDLENLWEAVEKDAETVKEVLDEIPSDELAYFLHHRRALPVHTMFTGPIVARPKFEGPVLLKAVFRGEVSIVEKLLDAKADPDQTYTMTNCGVCKADAKMPLLFAALHSKNRKNQELTIGLLECLIKGGADIQARAIINCHVHSNILWEVSWLSTCSCAAAADFADFLIQKRADLNKANGWYIDCPPRYVEDDQMEPCETRGYGLAKVLPCSSPDVPEPCALRLLPGHRYSALGMAVKKGAHNLVVRLVWAKAEVTRHELMIAATISNAALVCEISDASARSKSPLEALRMLEEFEPRRSPSSSNSEGAGAGARVAPAALDLEPHDAGKRELYRGGEMSQVHKDLLYEMVRTVLAVPEAEESLKKEVKSARRRNSLDSEIIPELIRHSPEAARLLLDNIYLQVPDCFNSRNPVPLQCVLDVNERMNTVYVKDDQWKVQSNKLAGRISADKGQKLTIESERESTLLKPIGNSLNLWEFSFDGDNAVQSQQDPTAVLNVSMGGKQVEVVHVDLRDLRPGIWSHFGEKTNLLVKLAEHREEDLKTAWQRELLRERNAQDATKQFCDIRILRVRSMIRLELFNAIGGLSWAERLKLLQECGALEAVIHFTWGRWAQPQHLVVFVCETIRVIALLVWVGCIALSSEGTVTSSPCEVVEMACWALFTSVAVVELIDDLAVFCADCVFSGRRGLAKLSMANCLNWVLDIMWVVFAFSNWGSWQSCAHPEPRFLFAVSILFCCCNWMYSWSPFRGFGYALAPILDTLQNFVVAKPGKVSNLLAMLMVVILLVFATSLFASVVFDHDKLGLYPTFVRAFMNIIVGEAELLDLETFSDDGWSVLTILCAFFGIGVVLMNIFIAVVGKSYEEILKTNLGSFLDRRNAACQKAVLLRRGLLSCTARCEECLWAPEEGGVLCLRGLVTPPQAVLLYQHLVLFAFAALGCLALHVDLAPLLLVICITFIILYVKCAVIVSHTDLQGRPKNGKPEGRTEPDGELEGRTEPEGKLEGEGKPEGQTEPERESCEDKNRREFWWIPDCYVWVAKATVPRLN